MNRCPGCNSETIKYLDTLSVNQEFTHNILATTYKILKCKSCNLYFKNCIPNDSELNAFYNSLGDKEWDYQQVYPHEIYLKNILKNLPDRSSVLDVGCNTGRLLKEETGRLNCSGVEINKDAAKIAAMSGIKVVAEKVENDILGEGKFELITLVDVFEHLNDPMSFIKQLVKALKPKGKLYIFTGRTDCLPAKLCGSYYWYYKPAQHLIFLNNGFIKWFAANNSDVNVSVIPMSHFNSSLRTRVYQISWHIAWRFFSPNSPYRFFSIKRLAKLKQPFMITSWKDHMFFIIEKNSL